MTELEQAEPGWDPSQPYQRAPEQPEVAERSESEQRGSMTNTMLAGGLLGGMSLDNNPDNLLGNFLQMFKDTPLGAVFGAIFEFLGVEMPEGEIVELESITEQLSSDTADMAVNLAQKLTVAAEQENPETAVKGVLDEFIRENAEILSDAERTQIQAEIDALDMGNADWNAFSTAVSEIAYSDEVAEIEADLVEVTTNRGELEARREELEVELERLESEGDGEMRVESDEITYGHEIELTGDQLLGAGFSETMTVYSMDENGHLAELDTMSLDELKETLGDTVTLERVELAGVDAVEGEPVSENIGYALEGAAGSATYYLGPDAIGLDVMHHNHPDLYAQLQQDAPAPTQPDPAPTSDPSMERDVVATVGGPPVPGMGLGSAP